MKIVSKNTLWRVGNMKQKSHAACVVGRESAPNYLLKKIVGTWLPEEEEQEEEEQECIIYTT